MNATLAHIRQRYTLLAICNECAHTIELDTDSLIGTVAHIASNFNRGLKIKSRPERCPRANPDRLE